MVLGVGFASCSDFLDQSSPSAMDDKNIFSTYEYAQGAINNCYTYFAEQNYRARTIYYGYNTDIEYYNSSNSLDDKANLATYDARPSNGQMNDKDGKDLWSQMYKGVERANLAIQGLRSQGELTDPKMRHLLGEALTLRALTYVDLINMWGDVPARFEPVNSSNMYAGRTSKDVIYKQLIADLQEAADLCAWPNELDITTTVTRINKAFVKGLLARVCLYASGYSLYRDGQYRLSNDPELSKDVLYPIALQACVDVMAQEGKSVALKNKFEDIWNNKGISGDVISAGNESLFEVGYSDGPVMRGRIMYTFGLKHNDADAITTMKQGSQVGPTPNLFFDYDVADTRRDVTCCPFQWEKGVQVPQSINKWSFGKLRYEWTNRMIASGNDEGINKLYMRYADIILMRAEIENYLYGPSAAAPYVKKIRQRAFPQSAWATEVDAYVNSASSKDAMQKLIMQERAFEFAGEFLRKADLIRWGVLKEKLDEAKTKMTQLYNLEGDYSDINPYLYWKMSQFSYTRDGMTYALREAKCDFYGLNHGETDDPGQDWKFWTNSSGEKSKWISASDTNMEKVNVLYTGDPIMNMYWPIFDINLNDNQNLNNNFGDEETQPEPVEQGGE